MRSLWAILIGILTLGSLSGVTRAQSPVDRRPNTYTVYYFKNHHDDRKGALLVPVIFPQGEGATGTESLRLAFQALCERPPAGLYSAVKPGCKIISAQSDGSGALVVNTAAGDLFPRGGTTSDTMVVEQFRMTASQFSAQRVILAVQGKALGDLGSHGLGNNFAVTGRSRMFLVSPPIRPGERIDTNSLTPSTAAVRNMTSALGAPLLGVINRRLTEEGRTDHLVREVDHIIASGDGSLWVTTRNPADLYRVWWSGKDWQVEGSNLPG